MAGSLEAKALRIETIGRGRSERVRFWRAGLAPYEGDPHFVTPLLMDCHRRWAPHAPVFDHAETQHFIAVRSGRDVGRVAATIDRRQDEVHGDATGLFGWFECQRDPEVASALLSAAERWLRERGRDRMRGPVCYTMNGISGLLVRDDRPGPPVVDMAYNPPWYPELLEGVGLEGAQDLVAFWVETPETPDARLARITERALKRGGFTIRPIRVDRRGFDADIDHVLRIYNRAWEKNWGFVPMTESELREEAASFKPILRPELALFAEKEGEVVGFSLTIPDANRAIGTIRGRLWPWSAIRMLLALRRVNTGRTITLGVLPEYRRSGLDAALIHRSNVNANTIRLTGAECSWVLADNVPMIRGIEQTGGVAYRWYRIYEKAL